MKKALSIVIVLVMVLSLALAGCASPSSSSTPPADNSGGTPADNPGADTPDAPEADGTVYTINASFIPSDGTPTIDSYKWFKEQVEERSGGRIVVNVYSGGAMGNSDADNTEKCAQNIVQMTTSPTHTLSEFTGIKEYAVTTVPFMFTSPEEINTFIDSDLMAGVNADLTAKTGLRVYGGFYDGFMAIATSKTPCAAPADIAGLKIRVQTSDAYINAVNELGASAIPMGAGEIFTALQQGTIDGISGIPQMIVNEQYYEVLKYGVDVNAFVNYHMILLNDAFYQGLPADLQAILDECMADLVDYARDLVGQYAESAITTCEENGMTFVRLTDAERQVWRDACQGTYEAMCADFGEDFIASVEELLGR